MTPEKSKAVMLCPLYSANPKTKQESIYIWLIFPWPVSPDPRKYVVLPLHKLLCHFPRHHHHTLVCISYYLHESRKKKSEFNHVRYQLFKARERGGEGGNCFHIRTLKFRSIISEIGIKCDRFLNKLKETLHIYFLPIAELSVIEFLYSTAACAV